MACKVKPFTKGMIFPSSAYLDANFIISTLDVTQSRPVYAHEAFAELLSQGVEILLSSLVIDEVWWGLLCDLNEQVGRGRLTSKKIRSDPKSLIGQHIAALERAWNAIRQWPQVRWVPDIWVPSDEQVEGAFQLMSKYNLGPRDSFHLYLAMQASAGCFITEDEDFDRLDGTDIEIVVIKIPT